VTTEPRTSPPPFVRSVWPPLAIMAFATIMFVWTLRYNDIARQVPLLVASALFFLGVFDLVCRIDRRALDPLRDFWGGDFGNPEMKHHPRVRDEAIQIGWMIASVAGMMLLGILPTVPLFIFFYTKVQGKRPWLESLLVAAIIFIFVYAVFELFLDYRLYRGALFDPRGFQAW
jgi:hypothetical protein